MVGVCEVPILDRYFNRKIDPYDLLVFCSVATLASAPIERLDINKIYGGFINIRERIYDAYKEALNAELYKRS